MLMPVSNETPLGKILAVKRTFLGICPIHGALSFGDIRHHSTISEKELKQQFPKKAGELVRSNLRQMKGVCLQMHCMGDTFQADRNFSGGLSCQEPVCERALRTANSLKDNRDGHFIAPS
jgi:hypothetical protein